MNRAVDLYHGHALVVTDLHGDWGAYTGYRDMFLALRDEGRADVLIFTGDLIYSPGPPETDYSLNIVLDVVRLRDELGPQTVIVLLGNHELPHIYGVTLAKGDTMLSPRFEHALGEYRSTVIGFFKSLPFMVRTPGGVLLTHAGASRLTANADAARRLLSFSHDDLLEEVDRLLARNDVNRLIESFQQTSSENYAQTSWEYLAVSGPEDPRFLDLLRGLVASSLEPEWPELWDLLFTQCEMGMSEMLYGTVLARFLEAYAAPGVPQHVLVSGHKPAPGYAIVAGRQLRLASWAHATPRDKASYLLFDVTMPVSSAEDLLPSVCTVY